MRKTRSDQTEFQCVSEVALFKKVLHTGGKSEKNVTVHKY